MNENNIRNYDEYQGLSKSNLYAIRKWMIKYNKYFNYYNEFSSHINKIIDDIIDTLKIDKKHKDAIERYILSLYDSSDDLSIKISTSPNLDYTQIDQISRFEY